MMSLGTSLAEARRKAGLTQERVAEKLGVSRQTINAIENDKYDPTLALAFHLARQLGCTVDELFSPLPEGN